MYYYDTSVKNPFVAENVFLQRPVERDPLPTFAASRDRLPAPLWAGHDDAIACYWKAWELTFANLRAPADGSGFVSNFIDTAFNDCLFMWDSAFILMFGRYGSRVFDFQGTLNNFYAKQHKDGYICRQLRRTDGAERFERFDPSSTGPNVMPWSEWEYFCNTGDRDRLAKVFPVFVAYTQWLRRHRTWQDGTYFSSGWGCGMDNQPRQPAGYNEEWEHGHLSWIDTTCQQILADRHLLRMAATLGREVEVTDLAREVDELGTLVNQRMWNDSLAFYTDKFRDGSLSTVKGVAGFWPLLAGIVPSDRLELLLAHLKNEREFNRPHRVPSLSADHQLYDRDGDYWRGAVWAPTNYMILRGLTEAGQDDLAYDIGRNHVDNVVEAYVKQGTLFENYAPESAKGMFRRDLVGWGGLPPITVLFEYVLGLRPNMPAGELQWDIRLTDEHGVSRYPFGADGLLDLHCEKRSSPDEEPQIQARANRPIRLVVKWKHGREIEVTPAAR